MEACRRCGGSGTEPDMKAFGEAVRAEREKRGWSLREFARRARCSPAYVHDVEYGRRGGKFSGEATERIMNLLDLEVPKCRTAKGRRDAHLTRVRVARGEGVAL